MRKPSSDRSLMLLLAPLALAPPENSQLVMLLLLQMSSTLEDIRVKNRQLAEANMGKQEAINEVSG